MRETKFRYRIKEKKSGEIKFLYVEMAHIENPLIFGEIYWNQFDILSRDEYTGLKDKNRKEIYERDIVEYKYDDSEDIEQEVIGSIKWDLKFQIALVVKSHGIMYRLVEADLKGIEVIGNIYENPEMLKDKK